MKTEQVTYDVELTDTFAGEPNYSWVRRAEVTVAPDESDLSLVRKAKAAVGITGVPCKRALIGDVIELRPIGSCTVCFIVCRPKNKMKALVEQGDSESQANARLIEAAPEMLELLKDVSAWLEKHLRKGAIHAGTHNRGGDLVSQLRDIISRATLDA